MHCGFDFGTSNCLIGYAAKGEPTLIPIDEGDVIMPSSMWSAKTEVTIKTVSEDEIERRYQLLIGPALHELRAEIKRYRSGKLTDEEQKIYQIKSEELRQEIRRKARQVLSREAAQKAKSQYETQGISDINQNSIIYGKRAIHSHALYPDDGIYFKSPKTFLGSSLDINKLNSFCAIVKKMIMHVKTVAENNSGYEFNSVVFGRPVNYGRIDVNKSNIQALQIMSKSAKDAGFSHIEFEYEPVAAALDFERTLTKESRVLVVDIGGGTTDITMMRLSDSMAKKNDRAQDILASAGDWVGGNDLDISIALRGMSHYLGNKSIDRNGVISNRDSPINSGIYTDAMRINDLKWLDEFRSSGDVIRSGLSRISVGSEMHRMVSRFKVLHEKNLVYRFNHSAELAKIRLSDEESIALPIDYLGDNFLVQMTREDLEFYISMGASKIKKMIKEVIVSSGTNPDYIYFTGGSAKSPTLLSLIIDKDLQNKVIFGESFASVANGLSLVAHKRFG